MSACEPLVETCFSTLPGSGAGGPSLSGWVGTLASGWIWFRCAYDGCHPGVGHIIIEAQTGEILYDGCPTEGTRKLTWIDFPAAKLWEGGLMQVNYGLPGCSESGHVCSRATFEWGSYEDTANPLGVAYLDNAGGPNDRGNVCDGAALGVWRTISQGNVPDTPYIESAPPWGFDLPGYGVGGSNLPDHLLGPYQDDRWIFSGNIAADDDLMIDGVRVFADGYANQVGGGNVFLKFLPRGRVARVNVWNSGGWTGASGSLRLYSSGSNASSGNLNLTRCNAFIIPPETIGAYKFKNPGGSGVVAEGERKVFYRQGGLPDPVPCADAGIIPSGYVPKVLQATPQVTGGALTATATLLNALDNIPQRILQVPLAKRAHVGDVEYWRVNIFRNGSEMAGFYLVLFFPVSGFQGGMVEIGAAIDYTDYYITETVRVGQTAALRLSYTPWGEPAIELSLQVDVAFIPV